MNFQYSDKYSDRLYEYRWVTVPKTDVVTRILPEEEWRGLGITMSPGWVHYANYSPDNAMIFRRPLK